MPRFHKDGTLPCRGEIFVFGSNLEGVHGAGAALIALMKFGAAPGQGRGPAGYSYAIPTMGLPLEVIAEEVQTFLQFAAKRHKLDFFVTRIGCGLAGYADSDIAPLFTPLDNCSFAEEWRPYL